MLKIRIFTFILLMCLSQANSQEKPWHSDVDSWVYWLQDIDIDKLVECDASLAVLDYSRDGSDDEAFTAEEIESVVESGTIPVAYLSIGEVEDYRFYWKDHWETGKPGFIGPENPDWEGNYKAKYWQDAYWRAVIRPYLRKIIAAGFKGVYLDIIDAYYYWHEEGYGLGFTSRKMVRLVERISKYCRREADEDFLIIPQNGISIIDDAPEEFVDIYLDSISAVGAEDLFFHIYSEADQAYRLDLFSQVAEKELPLFNVEYLSSNKIKEYLKRISESGLQVIPYRARPNRELDELLCNEFN